MQFSLSDNIRVLKWAMQSTMTKSIDAILIADFPVLATPVLRQVMNMGVSYVIGKLMTVAEMQTFFIYTDLRVSAQGREFVAQAEKHQLILKTGTPEEKAKSEEELFHSFRQLAMLKG